ncbi:MAG TPA: imidazole glycerol phosphate synthase subunit HisF [Candidatus Sulfotelmatobacter sp.]|jgi:cyclase|nr:imidazole glycerol phosphate synthase subunit HisF [Candidatus Sulfotelmatobacter sp.]
MLVKRIIACLDIKDGRVVKGVKFDNHEDAGDPIALAKKYAAEGVDELVFYDITASADKRNIMLDLVKKVAKEIFIPFTVGGGIKSIEDIRALLLSGADKISLNTAALENPNLINEASQQYYPSIVIGIDSLYKDGKDIVYSHTGRREARKNTKRETLDWIREVQERGAGEITINSMNADGTKRGYDIRLFRKINVITTIPVIASGGAGKLEDFADAFTKGNVDAALAASLFHFGDLKINDVKNYLKKSKIPVRN